MEELRRVKFEYTCYNC